MNKSVAIDGPAGAGKSTLARRLAQRLGFLYVDTGAIYRTVGLYTLRNRLAPEEVVPMLEKLDIRMEYDSGGVQRMRLNGEDVSEAIRVHEVSQRASQVAALPEVRAFLLDFQRRQAREHSVVMDGRDIGTVVLPDADVKIFLTASPEVRAKRRLLELEQRGQPAQYEQILQDIQDRDRQDRNRAAAPLRQAEDAVLLDTSGLDLEQSLTQMLEIVSGRKNGRQEV
ncbi:MAG: (d)CMP kinase [Oscillospiraceae bacterium]|jgi:cytidylate kinase|nr:(d)CMP kinase [Oscillospiraceae bacterium]